MPEGTGYGKSVKKGNASALGSQYEGYGDGELTKKTKTAKSKLHMSMNVENRPVVGRTPHNT